MREIIYMLISIMVLVSCKKDEDEKTGLPNFAFEVGNTWYYNYVDDKNKSDDSKLPYDFKVTIEKDTTINGITGIKKVVEDYGLNKSVYYAKLKTDGLYRYAFLENGLVVYDEPVLDYKLPFSIGDSWEYQNGFKEVIGQENVVATNVNFDCKKVVCERGHNREYEWIAAEGLIQKLSIDSIGFIDLTGFNDTIWFVDTISHYRLVNFELN